MPHAGQYERRRQRKLCTSCGTRRAPDLVMCPRCYKMHLKRQGAAMKKKRADPAYRERERVQLRLRMRKLRAERRAQA